jgi:hypothetical protein
VFRFVHLEEQGFAMAVSMVRGASVTGAMAVVGLLLLACGDGGSKRELSDAELIAKRDAKLRECGVLSEGRLAKRTWLDPQARCEIERCVLPTACDVLRAGTCGWGGIENGGDPLGFPVIECRSECDDSTRIACDGELHDAEILCNGYEDCIDGTDEADCEGKLFDCGDGGFAANRHVCDGDADCENGKDEQQDCAMFACGSGEKVPDAQVCDGWPNCLDESDEADCASYCSE